MFYSLYKLARKKLFIVLIISNLSMAYNEPTVFTSSSESRRWRESGFFKYCLIKYSSRVVSNIDNDLVLIALVHFYTKYFLVFFLIVVIFLVSFLTNMLCMKNKFSSYLTNWNFDYCKKIIIVYCCQTKWATQTKCKQILQLHNKWIWKSLNKLEPLVDKIKLV